MGVGWWPGRALIGGGGVRLMRQESICSLVSKREGELRAFCGGGGGGGEGSKYNGRVVIHLGDEVPQGDVLLGGLARLG